MRPGEIIPHASADDSALAGFLRRSVVYERAGAALPRDLVTFGLWGAAIILGAGIVALLLPSPEAIRHGGFFLLFGGLAAGMGALVQSATAALLVSGTLLLGLDVFLMLDRRPRSDGWRSAVVAQAVAGGAGGVISTVFLALVIVNLVLWIIIFTLLAIIVFGVVMALLQGG